MNSKWLFQNYRRFLAEYLLLVDELAIEGDGLWGDNKPSRNKETSKHLGLADIDCCSRCERIVLSHEEKILRLDRCKRYIRLYQSIFLILTDSERWIVHTHFEAGWNIEETLALVPEHMFFSSRSSLIRRINKLLKKTDTFLNELLGDIEKDGLRICNHCAQQY